MLVENIPSRHGSESPLDPSSDPDMALPLIQRQKLELVTEFFGV